METIDFTRECREIYAARRDRSAIVDVPEMQFLMIDGEGEPAGAEFAAAVQALYSVSFPVKFAIKERDRLAFKVMPLEGLFSEPTDAWKWRLMIMQPDFVMPADIADGVAKALGKDVAAAGELRLERFAEGRSAQVLHVGPYSEEKPTIDLLHEFIEAEGLTPRGLHHEIYIGDPSRSKPENLKTIIRMPVTAA
jgi:hypothetical protein